LQLVSLVALDGCCTPKRFALPRGPEGVHTETLFRRDDMLALELRVVGFKRNLSKNQLVPDGPGPRLLVVEFPPQAIQEKAFFEQRGVPPKPVQPPVLERRMARPGSTRLVFLLRDQPIPYDLCHLLGWGQLLDAPDRQASCGAAYGGPSLTNIIDPGYQPKPPTGEVTAIELPLHLLISPGEATRWAHAAGLFRSVTEHTELWHTQLRPGAPGGRMEARALWADDYEAYDQAHPELSSPPTRAEDYTTSLTPVTTAAELRRSTLKVRAEIVDKTTNAGRHTDEFTSAPLAVDRLALSSLGGWLTVRGDWKLREGTGLATSLEAWRYIATMGRDQYGEVMTRCYLYPFGHRGSEVSETVRSFEIEDGRPIAPLRQRNFILVRELEREIPQARELPFARVRVLTERSPDLVEGREIAKGIYFPLTARAANPADESQDRHALFQVRATDHDGRSHDFATPLIVVKNTAVLDAPTMAKLAEAYEKLVGRLFSPAGCDLGSARIAYLRRDEVPDADPVLATSAMRFAARATPDGRFVPTMTGATVRLPAVEQLAGPQGKPFDIRYLEAYRASGFGDVSLPHVKLAAFAEVVSVPDPVDLSLRVPLISPNLAVRALSATLGPLPVTGLDAKLDPATFFPDSAAMPRLLGGIKLREILESVARDALELGGERWQLPRLTSLPDCVRYDWETGHLKSGGIFRAENDGASAQLAVHAMVCVRPGSAEPRREAKTTLTNFTLHFLGILAVQFAKLEVTRRDDKPPEVSVKVSKVAFAGDLAFLEGVAEKVRKLVGKLLPTPVEIRLDGIHLKYRLAMPDFEAGAFTLRNVALGFRLEIPYDGSPCGFSLSFADRQHPFLMGAALLAGGGWLTLHFRTDLEKGVSVVAVEGAFELGGNLSLDLVVARGQAYVLVGIYFYVGAAGFKVGGYVRLGGALDILGLITVSVEFYLGLTYDGGRQALYGEASLTISIEILFFSASVTLHVQRCFKARAEGTCLIPPPVEDDALATDWTAYWKAFA